MEDKIKGADKDKGLTDKHNGDLILNESGTSIEIGHLDEQADGEQHQADNRPQKREGEDVEKGMVQPPYNIADQG